MHKIKFNRGPKNGERAVWLTAEWAIRVMQPPAMKDIFNSDGITVPVGRYGEYHRSHRRLKDGTAIYEWMGWVDGRP